ncbi:MAG: alpha amylase N-terminal ig-like domain-containing protein, partial [Armatimonadetes bacterium]|nr:alpha amylase N-terminal ig-like domain-containing protein [Anaerolineae bacterium]
MTLPSWATGLHHDGSDAYVADPYPTLDQTVMLTLRVPLGAPLQSLAVRTEPDGEAHHTPMHLYRQDAVSGFWQVELKITQPRNHYRFRLLTETTAYWYNALGLSRVDGPDAYDFKLLANYAAPHWVNQAVFYQIFPDRFYQGDATLLPQPGAWTNDGHSVQVRAWGEPPLTHQEGGNLDFFGGDLPGITQKLDYLSDLGVTALYLTPIFSSPSNHRYNIDDFYNVDAHLGGNDALVALRQGLDAHAMRLILDITPNHVSSLNPWFTEAQRDPNAPTAEYFTFQQRPNHYSSWLGVKSLPKLNYGSLALRQTMYAAPDSIIRHWLKPPYRIDGWRLDVANMTGRQGATQQLSYKVKRGIRHAVKAENPEAYLIGENFFDSTSYLQGDSLDGIQNYQGFMIPVLRWLSGLNPETLPPDIKPLETDALAEYFAAYRTALPWAIANQQLNLLGSHDTPRILSVVHGDVALAQVGVGLLMTYPGVPCIYYGDEIGMLGMRDPDNRRTMPWDESQWNHDLRAYYQRLIALRRGSHALQSGGYQQLEAAGERFVYQRQSSQQRLIIV